MLSSPGLIINIEGVPYEYHGTTDFQPNDPTSSLNEQMRTKVSIPYTQPSLVPGYLRDYANGLPDEQYNCNKYGSQIVDNQVVQLPTRFEAPNVPVSHLPFQQQLYNSTLVYAVQEGQILYSQLRSPGINEGM